MRILCHFDRKKSGAAKSAVQFEVYISRAERLYVSVPGVKIEPKYWDSKLNLVKPGCSDAVVFNASIIALKEKLNTIAEKLIKSGQIITKDIFKKAIQEGGEEMTLNEYLEKQIQQDRYSVEDSTYKRLTSFLKNFNNFGELHFNELTSNTIREYHIHLLKTMQPGSTSKNHKALSKYLRRAMNDGLISKNPYLNFKIPPAPRRTTFLTSEELDSIRQKIINNDRLNVVKDMFLFMCLTGLEYIDLQMLKHTDIIEKEGNSFIIKPRKKTNEVYAIPLLSEALEIISRYPATKENKDFVFPRRSNQKLNTYLVEIATLCNIEKPLTTIIARHTFATNMLSRGLPLETISHILGHSTTKTTRIYAKLITSKITADLQRLGITNI